MADLARRLAVARGDEPADLVVRGGRVLSVFTREWLETDIAIANQQTRRHVSTEIRKEAERGPLVEEATGGRLRRVAAGCG